MKAIRKIALGILACIVLASGAYFWATGMMDSIYAYRSPLHDNPPAPGQPLGEPLVRRVVFVLIDALREDTSLDPEVMPFLNELRQQGAWATMHSRPPSYSELGYTVLLTGAWPDVSDGPAVNADYDDIPTWTQDNLFSAAKRAGLGTAVSGYYWFEKLIPQRDVSASFYTPGEDRTADRVVVDAALPWLEDGSYQLVLIHLDQIDYAGHHEGGPLDPRWDVAARRADSLLREIAATLDLTQDTLFICSDHGQIDQGGHGGQDSVVLIEPFVLVGAGVSPGQYDDVNMVDVAPTLAALLGANIPASNQGHVRSEMLTVFPGQLQIIREALDAQQNQLVEAYQTAIGQRVAVELGNDASYNAIGTIGDTVAMHQAALVAARKTRLNAERLPRFVLALGVVLLPVFYMFHKRNRDLAWLLGGAIIYTLAFNLRYALVDQRTYSLSSVASADGLILYCAVTALISLVIAWLVTSLGLKTFHRGTRQAAESALGLTLITVYLLLLPVMWSFALNGATVTCTLPEMGSTFLAFISLIQILLVAVLGLVLTGLTALIAKFTTH